MATKSYRDYLYGRLEDLEFAAGYLEECLKEGESAFLVGLHDVVNVHGGVGKLAKETELNREGLYRVLSEQGNPTLSSLARILDSLGIEVKFTKKMQGSEAA